MTTPLTFASVVTRFFTNRLIAQRHASVHTIASYRDTFRLLLRFTRVRTAKEPSQLTWEDIDAPLIAAFLDDLELNRGVSARSRNLRLTAVRSLFRYAAFEHPQHGEQIQRVLAIPSKRFTRRQIGYLTRSELDTLLGAPDRCTWSGRRDYCWLLVSVQTGLRVSELTGLTREDVHLGNGAYVHVVGKGRKERVTPLTKSTGAVVQAWLNEPPHGDRAYVFPNRLGGRLSNDGLQYLLAQHVAKARKVCASLNDKRISPHVLRHTAAMNLLQAGVDTTVIGIWLGHESVETTRGYLEADLELKRKILNKTADQDAYPARYQPDDALLAFLQSL